MLRRPPPNPELEAAVRQLHERVVALEREERLDHDRVIALALARAYEQAVPRRRSFPWGAIVTLLSSLAYFLLTYLTQK